MLRQNNRDGGREAHSAARALHAIVVPGDLNMNFGSHFRQVFGEFSNRFSNFFPRRFLGDFFRFLGDFFSNRFYISPPPSTTRRAGSSSELLKRCN